MHPPVAETFVLESVAEAWKGSTTYVLQGAIIHGVQQRITKHLVSTQNHDGFCDRLRGYVADNDSSLPSTALAKILGGPKLSAQYPTPTTANTRRVILKPSRINARSDKGNALRDGVPMIPAPRIPPKVPPLLDRRSPRIFRGNFGTDRAQRGERSHAINVCVQYPSFSLFLDAEGQLKNSFGS